MQIVHQDQYRTAARLLGEQGQRGRADHEAARWQSVPQPERPFQRETLPCGQRPGVRPERPQHLAQDPEGDT